MGRQVTITADDVYAAVDHRMMEQINGLCWSFCAAHKHSPVWYRILRILCRELGNESTTAFYFDTEEDRLLFLAFMLTWAENEEEFMTVDTRG